MSRLIDGLAQKVASKVQGVTEGLGDGLQKVANKTEDIAKRVNRTVNPLSSHFGEKDGRDPAAEGLRAEGFRDQVPAARGTANEASISRMLDKNEFRWQAHLSTLDGVGSGFYLSPNSARDLSPRLRPHLQGPKLTDPPIVHSFPKLQHQIKRKTTVVHFNLLGQHFIPVPLLGREQAGAELVGSAAKAGTEGVRNEEQVSSRVAFDMTQQILDALETEIKNLENEKKHHQAALEHLERLRAEQEEAYAKAEELMAKREKDMLEAIKALEDAQGSITVLM